MFGFVAAALKNSLLQPCLQSKVAPSPRLAFAIYAPAPQATPPPRYSKLEHQDAPLLSRARVTHHHDVFHVQSRVVSIWCSDPLYARHPLGLYLVGVTASAAVVGVFSHLRTTGALFMGIKASKRLHGALLRRVLHAPVSFFDTTPVGRTIQRFAKDTDQVRGWCWC